MRFILSDDERALVALRRAVVAYGAERARWDAGRDDPHDETAYLELHADCSGSLWVDPSGAPSFRVAVFHALGPCSCRECDGRTAAEIVDGLRSAIEMDRIERGGARFGDPRRGRARAAK